jgi:hypothetical protein
LKREPSVLCSASIIATLRVIPPVSMKPGSRPTRRISWIARPPSEIIAPIMMSSAGMPFARWLITSDSANTAQTLLIGLGEVERLA